MERLKCSGHLCFSCLSLHAEACCIHSSAVVQQIATVSVSAQRGHASTSVDMPKSLVQWHLIRLKSAHVLCAGFRCSR